MLRLARLLVLAVLTSACAGGPPRTTTESTKPAEPTPNLQATVQAAVSATVQAAPKPTEAPPAAQKPTVVPAPAAVAGSPAPTPTIVVAAKPVAPTPIAEKPAAAPAAASPSSAPAQVRVEVVDVNTYKNSIGATVIQGLVENKGGVPAANLNIAVSLLGDGGSTVGAAQAFVKPRVLKAGATAPWSAQISAGPDFKDVRVQAQAEPAPGMWERSNTQDFKLEGVSVIPAGPPLNSPKISGQVTNTGPRSATLVNIIAAVYGSDGNVVEVKNTFAALQEIAPGQSSPFQIDFLGGRGIREISKYDLFIEGTPKP